MYYVRSLQKKMSIDPINSSNAQRALSELFYFSSSVSPVRWNISIGKFDQSSCILMFCILYRAGGFRCGLTLHGLTAVGVFMPFRCKQYEKGGKFWKLFSSWFYVAETDVLIICLFIRSSLLGFFLVGLLLVSFFCSWCLRVSGSRPVPGDRAYAVLGARLY